MTGSLWTSPPMTRRRVLVRDPEQTEMVVPNVGEATGFAKQLLKRGKGFEVVPNEDGTWTFHVYEINEPSRWEHA